MYERILVPLDGSNTAEMVLPYVEEIAARLGAEIFLTSVAESSAADMDRLYRSYLEHVMERVRHRLKDYVTREEAKVHTEVLFGKPAGEILHCADETNAGLIAMASRGSSGRGPRLLGSIAAKVLRAAGRPVLLIKSPATEAAVQQKRLMRKILVPLDGSKAGEAAIPFTEVLARAVGAEVILFQVLAPVRFVAGFETVSPLAMPPSEESIKASAIAYLNKVAKALEEKGIRTATVVVWGSAAERIADYTEANTIDLIAISTHGSSGIGRWVFGSVTEKVLHAGDMPVLVVSPAKP